MRAPAPVVLNQAVTLGPCAIAHGNLSIVISSRPVISQPAPLSQGQTVVTQKSDIQINQDPGNIIQMPASAQLSDVVRAQRAGRHAARPAGHSAGHQGGRRTQRRVGGDLHGLLPVLLAPLHAGQGWRRTCSRCKTSSATPPRTTRRHQEAARQFESLFMREMIKSMREATMKSGLLDGAHGDLGTDMLDQQLSVQMSGQPGGLSEIIARQLAQAMGVEPAATSHATALPP